MRVAIQGEVASFHHTAAKQWFGDDVTIVPCESFAEVFGAVSRHDADAAIVAIENSLYGSINQVYDLIESFAYPIIGEVHLPIHQQLITLPGATSITTITSHPVALAQCAEFISSNYPNAERIEFPDTAGAVAHIKELGDPHIAAIASETAAKQYGLPILHTNIEDNPANFTRFLVLHPTGSVPADANRTSLVLQTDHAPGALARILGVFADANINLSKLQSRPVIGQPWTYRFYIVLDTAGEPLHAVLKKIRPFCKSLTILGEYRHNPVKD